VSFPAIGDEIDGCIKDDGKLDIPWFPLDAAEVHHNIPTDLSSGQRIRMRVTGIKTAKNNDKVRSMYYRNVVTELALQYLGELPAKRRELEQRG
jgi:hypothetical protein